MGLFFIFMNDIALVMGVGAPDVCKSGDKTMCAILLSDRLGFFRIYPVPAENRFPVWSEIEVELERPETDSRDESWKLKSWNVIRQIKNPTEKRQILDSCCLKSGAEDPITFQNAQRKSIALVKPAPRSLGGTLIPREVVRTDNDWVYDKKRAYNKPALNWKSEQGSSHQSQLVSREVYECFRNYPDRPFDLFTNMQLGNPDWDFWLLLGNLKYRRNIWVAVHVHRLKKTTSRSTNLCLNLESGRQEGWPYYAQATGNVPVVDNQLLMFTTSDT